MNARPTWQNLLPGIIWTLVIFGLSIMPGVSLPESWADLLAWDKLAHCFVYGVQVYLLLLGFLHAGRLNRATAVGVFIFSVAFGALMELIQFGFFPGRYFELLDILANTIGSIIGWAVFRYTR